MPFAEIVLMLFSCPNRGGRVGFAYGLGLTYSVGCLELEVMNLLTRKCNLNLLVSILPH